jgi:hypothetical protein
MGKPVKVGLREPPALLQKRPMGIFCLGTSALAIVSVRIDARACDL